MALSFDLKHHCYIVAGDLENTAQNIRDILWQNFGIKKEGNPDFVEMDFSSIGIDESRLISQKQSVQAFTEKRIFIIKTNQITVPAKNALLKIFEEPSAKNVFFVIVPSHAFLIETLISRAVLLSDKNVFSGEEILSVKKILESPLPKRLKLVDEFLKKNKADTKETKVQANNFVGELEKELSKNVKANAEVLREILGLKKYIFDTSSSMKQILEAIAMLV
jgi:predicted ribosome quality control (RQC) complex YloA/Tae2 family protein